MGVKVYSEDSKTWSITTFTGFNVSELCYVTQVGDQAKQVKVSVNQSHYIRRSKPIHKIGDYDIGDIVEVHFTCYNYQHRFESYIRETRWRLCKVDEVQYFRDGKNVYTISPW